MTTASQPSRAGTTVRREIQALRGVAVLLVVVYHLWPDVLRGGFVGVDVFFVISGFLITRQLVGEADRTGRVALTAFWARRARRILPAALLVLAVCALATRTRVSPAFWEGFFDEILAGTLYVENWYLGSAAVDYLALDDAPSPVRHYWSLSLEEQFYVVWPVIVLLALLVGRRWLLPALAALTVGSFAWSLHAVAADPAAAFFLMPARAWEFGAGGLLALAPTVRPSRLLTAAGVAAVGAAAVAFSPATAFPGLAAALPVLGAAAVICGRSLRLRPLEHVGDISYSVYLWHWPLLVLAPGMGRFWVLVLSLAGGWATKVAVEDPARRLRLPPGRTLAAAAAGTAAVALLGLAGSEAFDDRVDRERRALRAALADPPRCFGAAAVHTGCVPAPGVVPGPLLAADLPNAPCTRLAAQDLVRPCAFGAPAARGRRTIALVGDSHASHWRAALGPVAERQGWHGVSITRSGCALSTGDAGPVASDRAGCRAWRGQVTRWLARHPEVDTLFVGQVDNGRSDPEDYVEAWRALPPSIRHIAVLRDTPQMLTNGETLECVLDAVEARRPPGSTCRRARVLALPDDPARRAVVADPRAVLVDLTRFFCDERWCRPVIGGVLVYKDFSHVTAVYGATLEPYLESELQHLRLLKDP